MDPQYKVIVNINDDNILSPIDLFRYIQDVAKAHRDPGRLLEL